MKPRKTISIYVLLVGVMALLIAGGILSFQLIDEATKNQLSSKQRELVKPLDGKIEIEVIENLTKRKVFSREELTRLPVPTQIITITPEATASTVAATPVESTDSAKQNEP